MESDRRFEISIWTGAAGTDMGEEWDADPFAVVTSDTRVAILRALAERVATEPTDPSMAFADLRTAAGVDDSGNFNYHLDRLRPEFVRRNEEGYRLTPAGIELVGRLRAGVHPEEPRGPEPLDHECSLCETALSVSYEDGLLAVACEKDHHQPRGILPPNAMAERDLSEAAELLVIRTVQQGAFVRRGVCPVCYGEMVLEHVVAEEGPTEARNVFRGTCESCGMVYAGPTGAFVLRHPAVVSFCRDHGVVIDEGGYWSLDLPLVGGSVVGEEPLRVSVSETLGRERLTIVVGADLSVVDTRRGAVEASTE